MHRKLLQQTKANPKRQNGIQHIAGDLKEDNILRIHFETITDNLVDPSKWHWQTHRDVFKTLDDQYATLDLFPQAGIDFG
jgi:hypothetical protein